MGRRPELKSVELFEGLILVVEIFTILCLKPLKKCYTVWEHDPARSKSEEFLKVRVAVHSLWSIKIQNPSQK